MLTKKKMSTSIKLIMNNWTPKKLGYNIRGDTRFNTIYITKAYTTKNMFKHKSNELLTKPLNQYNDKESRNYIYNFFKMKKTSYYR